MNRILVADDEQGIRQLLTLVFSRAGYDVRTAENGAQALAMLQAQPAELLISDIRMPDMDGIELLRRVREDAPHTRVVMMTAFASLETAREAFKLGAEDFVQKPFDVEELKEIVKRTFERLQLEQENSQLREEVSSLKPFDEHKENLEGIIGRSTKMQTVYQLVKTVAAVPSTVLITGESGTGKELVAHAIHSLSPRAERPFISINCGAFTETLLESELFGYVRGAFTGANANRKGLFEAAHKGTIFLDEIGEMSAAMQVKLLRVLQEKKIRPVGGYEEILIDARVVAATNRNLPQMVKDNSFREDLFYRISVIPVELPPLRERAGDIKVLVNHFLEKFCRQTGKRISISARALELLEGYEWRGNVRELEHTIERAVALEPSDTIQPEGLPQSITNYNPTRVDASALPEEGLNLTAHLDHLERKFVMEALQRTDYNQSRAAELLHLPVRSLRHLLDKHDIRNLTAQMRDERRHTDTPPPRRRASDSYPRRRANDAENEGEMLESSAVGK